MPGPESISPIRVLVLVLTTVFAVETAIMLGLELLPPASLSPLAASILDALLLIAALSPVIWTLVVRPLRAGMRQRGSLLARVFRVQEEERARIARDLHDELGQSQTALLLAARTIVAASTLEVARSRAEELAQMASQTIEETRRIARGLAPGVLVDLGLATAAERLCEDVAASSGLEVERRIALPQGRLPREVEFAVYRVLQEALTNAIRHAHPRRIAVRLSADGGAVTLDVADDGGGLPADGNSPGLGLRSMRERAELLGGSFHLDSAPGRGTRLTARMPVTTQEAEP